MANAHQASVVRSASAFRTTTGKTAIASAYVPLPRVNGKVVAQRVAAPARVAKTVSRWRSTPTTAPSADACLTASRAATQTAERVPVSVPTPIRRASGQRGTSVSIEDDRQVGA